MNEMAVWVWVAVGVFPFSLVILGVLHRMGVACVFCKIILEIQWLYHTEWPEYEGRVIKNTAELVTLGLAAQNKMSLQYRVFRGNWTTVPVVVADDFSPEAKAMIKAQLSGTRGGCQNCGQ